MQALASRGGYLVVGGGALGRALTQQFTSSGERVFGVFDEDTRTHQRNIPVELTDDSARLTPGSYRGLKVSSCNRLPHYVSAFKCTRAVLAPSSSSEAQSLAEHCISSGITQIFNYSMFPLCVPRNIQIVQAGMMVPADQQKGRFETDFEVLGVLGRGGFGCVYRARNRLDGQLYAVKRVVLKGMDSAAVAEAEAMAKLSNHPNVVRYYSSWVEAGTRFNWAEPGSDSELDSESDEESESDTDSDEEQGERCSLFIQMELCEDVTLREWLQADTAWEVSAQQRMSSFIQLVEAVSHIHASGYVHKDIKPANIFLSLPGQVPRVGDFGLAESTSRKLTCCPTNGTFLYLAPELEPTAATPADWKPVDVYALGIVLFEMLCRFGTQMERIQLIGKLRQAHELPTTLLVEHPAKCILIRALTHPDPTQRPSAPQLQDQLVGFGIVVDQRNEHQQEIAELKEQLKDAKDANVQQQRRAQEQESKLVVAMELLRMELSELKARSLIGK